VFRLATLTRPAATALAAAAFAVTGCAAVTATASPASAPPASSAGARSGPLITEPGAGFGPVYHLIDHARHSVDVTMYELADTTAERDLAAAAGRGVRVRVVLDEREDHTNSDAYAYLKSHGVKVTWSSGAYRYTHQKTVIIDGSVAVIMTANLTSRYYSTTRDFLVVDASRPDVAAITRVFNADYAHRPVRPGDGRDLVWSPTDAQDKLLALINGATSSLRIYSEEMGDATVVDALISAAKRGVDVRVCGENTYGEYDSEFAKLTRAGVRVSYYRDPSGFYIHGKVIEADYGTRHAKVFIGSENFSSTSLNRNRELGLIVSGPAVLSSVARTFAADFRSGKHWS
jgi:phosphatidylserine/phosphatidylglycerophosphate/cardiolipin synthase-like enzyme